MASGEKLLLHHPFCWPPSPPYQKPGGVSAGGGSLWPFLTEMLFRGTRYMGRDEERFVHCRQQSLRWFGSDWQCALGPGSSPAHQGKAAGPQCANDQCRAATAAGLQQPLTSSTEECDLQPPYQNMACDWLKTDETGQSLQNLRAVGWIMLWRCTFFLHSPHRRGPHHDPPQPQGAGWSSPAGLSCSFTPWWLREYCD